jgi:hypothetical protein
VLPTVVLLIKKLIVGRVVAIAEKGVEVRDRKGYIKEYKKERNRGVIGIELKEGRLPFI